MAMSSEGAAGPGRAGHGLGDVLHAQLGDEVFLVRLDGGFGNPELVGHLLGQQAARKTGEHLPLARREPGQRAGVHLRGEPLHDAGGEDAGAG